MLSIELSSRFLLFFNSTHLNLTQCLSYGISYVSFRGERTLGFPSLKTFPPLKYSENYTVPKNKIFSSVTSYLFNYKIVSTIFLQSQRSFKIAAPPPLMKKPA